MSAALKIKDASDKHTRCYKPATDTVDGACLGVASVLVPSGELAFFLAGEDYRSDSSPAPAGKYLDSTLWWKGLKGINFTAVDLEEPEP